ncbi:MAG TPA: LacI family transcriptional regulator [Anaerolineae bacterium]|jgi:DNA-binding LacI/PurR family transcriptional regulator|nr:LacI family transcriptional regulator [Anaerolineae bacterium]
METEIMETSSPTNNPATIQDVADLAGVSIATVSRVVNGKSPVVAETAQRVMEAIRELNYVPRAAARILASKRTNTLGLIVPEISGEFFAPMLRGIEAAAGETGFDLLIHTTAYKKPEMRRHTLGEHNTDGLLVFIGSMELAELTRLESIGFPVVFLHQTAPEGLNIPVVTVENKKGAFLAVEHLIDVHQCRRIAYLSGPEGNEDSGWRERGYRLALEKYGIPFDPALVLPGDFSSKRAAQTVGEWLAGGLVFDAIFSGDDLAAVGAMSALREAGMRVPEDIKIIGFDDIPLARHLTPPLTTIHAPTEEVGRIATDLLVRLVRREAVEREILLPTELTIRQSCGCGNS